MNIRTTIIIWVSLLVGELHTLWEGTTEQANWILTRSVPMSVQWNVKYATDEVWFILMALAILNYQPNRINRTTVITYTVYCILDLFYYFYNYKQEGYGWVYTVVLVTWILIYNNGRRYKQGIAHTV